MLEFFSLTEIALLGTLAFCGLVQLVYLWGIFSKLAFYKPDSDFSSETEPVSVIIAARNESENLLNNLPAILEQDYPNYEVVVVNHCSWDDSKRVLEEMQQKYKHLKVSELLEQEKYPTGKKFAITIGIKAATHDLLLFTDADCVPAGNQWLRLMQSRFVPGKEIVLGYSPYRKEKGFLNLYIRFETFMTALLYFSFALMKNAFMGVGRNLAYHKETFFRHKGFANHQHILSGDDDLFVNEAAHRNNVSIQLSPESFVYTEPSRNFDDYSHQKSRHMTTGKYYKTKHKVVLGIYYLSLMFFYGTLAATLIIRIETWPVVLGIYLLRFLSQEFIYYKAAVKLQCTGILWAIPVLDFIYVFYLVIFGTKGLLTRRKKETW